MKSSNQVVLTETSIVVLSKGVFQTSIPLRHWSTHDGTTWSGLLRQGHQIEWLIGRLNAAFNDATTESTMQRVHRVLADPSMPPRVPPRPKRTAAMIQPTSDASTIIPPLVVPPPAPSRLRRNRLGRPARSPRPTVAVRLNLST
jgi:hypothetical protein